MVKKKNNIELRNYFEDYKRNQKKSTAPGKS